MANLRTYLLAGATLLCALTIGYVMQYGSGAPATASADGDETLPVTDITPTSSATVLPPLPQDIAIEGTQLGTPPVELAAATPEIETSDTPLPEDQASAGFDCVIEMTAETAAGAMVDLALNAPCHGSERVTIHHQGMMFTEVVQPDGSMSIKVPALAETATFIAAFASGDGGSATVDVTSLGFYDRVAVQWTGDTGLQLHAREYGADYFTEDHIWAAAAGDLSDAARGEGGFLTRLGQADAPDALFAEVYSFPSGTATRDGEVLVSVEAEITDANCGKPVEAQTLEVRTDDSLRIRDLTLDMPGCDGVGDFLVLKNLIEDLNIAAR